MEEKHVINETTGGIPAEEAIGGYSKKALEYITAPRNYGTLEKPDGHAKTTDHCGHTIEFFLKIRNKRIEGITYATDGCMTSHAVGSAATVLARGKTVKECAAISHEAILEHLGDMPEDAGHCAQQAVRTLNKALVDFLRGKKR
ncbi:MAG: iron-sulfur cluster assembly scaffold protein [Spirochaetes bacterium]|nr:iron-sulfur cluster assembly scaffold protein [Spirochaetota bacterium]